MNNKLIPVEGKPNLYRDLSSGAIVNNDRSSYRDHLKHVESIQNDKERIYILEQKVNKMSEDLSDIKNLLISLHNKS
jgi:hypothetical protein